MNETRLILPSCNVAIFDGDRDAVTVDLASFQRERVNFGRNTANDIALKSRFITDKHGFFLFTGTGWAIYDDNSTNGLYCEGQKVMSMTLLDGVSLKIDNPYNPQERSVRFLISSSAGDWQSIDLADRNEITIGRSKNCDIYLNHAGVSRLQARIVRENNGEFYLYNTGSSSISINNRTAARRNTLREKDLILITNTKIIFTKRRISYQQTLSGIGLEAVNLMKTVKSKRGSKNITNNISLTINPCEFVAIIGGSGAGKSTFMNCISGYSKATGGGVMVNGEDLYSNYEAMKSIIGYVPQQDIVFDNLTLRCMLDYAAKLRMPADTDAHERMESVKRVIETVELSGHEDTLIHKLSGGQKKRASIAVELLSEPNLFFLDEPTSGLDPGTERNLMHTLRKMSREGRTVILVTHNTLNLHLCDKIIIIGRGGNLCFFGNPSQAESFFGVESLVDVYQLIDDDSRFWNHKYIQSQGYPGSQSKDSDTPAGGKRKKNQPFFSQLGILCSRYIRLILNDKKRLVFLFGQALVLALLIKLVSNDKIYEQYNMTKAIMFALACSAFWIGIFNSIQEVCKEYVILRREATASLSLPAYVLSKFLVLALMCLVQTLILAGVFAVTVGLPEEGIIFHPFIEITGTTYICMLSAMCLGLTVSVLFKNPDQAMSLAPMLLMPQILFSGLAFELTGAVEKLSAIVSCRWAVEAYGTALNFNALPLALQEEFPMIEHTAESFFEYTSNHFLNSWAILLAMALLFVAVCIPAIQISLNKASN